MASQARVNLFAGSPLNRLSWLRPSQLFLNAVIMSPATRWLLFKSGEPLVLSTADNPTKRNIVYLTTNDVRPFLGSEPFFGQGEAKGQLVVESSDASGSPTEAARHHDIPVVFLGIQEPPSKSSALPSSDFASPNAAVSNLEGTPYFSMDISDLELTPENLQDILGSTSQAQEGILDWSEPRIVMSSLDGHSGGIFAEARSLVDWNQRNKFCPACGSRSYSMWGGWKLSCSSLLPWADNAGRKPCPTTKGLHNFMHPRTDPVVIMLAIDQSGDKILLGRGKKFPAMFYSALAGFVEPAETFEDAVVREMWEEAGVKAWDIRYHSGQPWPYPANLMLGFYARVDDTQPIRTDLDNELADARWFTRAEIQAVLHHTTGTVFGSTEYNKMAEHTEGKNNQNATTTEDSMIEGPPFKLPPVTAIAGVLIKDWAEGNIGFPPYNGGPTQPLQRGNL